MTPPNDVLDTLPATRRALLVEMKTRGEVTADDLAAARHLTVSAVRQHLASLSDDGYVKHRSVTEGRGRPRHLYQLTARAHALFPAAYGELTNELLDYFADADPGLVDHAFERRRQRRRETAEARLDGLALPEKVAELTKILDEDGYLAEYEALNDGTWRIIEHNCAIFAVAQRYGQACSSEIAFLRDVLPEAGVERESHMIAGAHICAYRVTPA